MSYKDFPIIFLGILFIGPVKRKILLIFSVAEYKKFFRCIINEFRILDLEAESMYKYIPFNLTHIAVKVSQEKKFDKLRR